VKRVAGAEDAPDGEVSTLLHRRIRPGDELTLSVPSGDVVLDEDDTPVVLVSAGIGCTPMVGMLDRLVATGSDRPVLVLHADRSPAEHALRKETRTLAARLPRANTCFWYEQPGPGNTAPGDRFGLMDLAGVDIPADATVYLCGPLPFMRSVRTQLLRSGVSARNIRYEVFGPDLWLPGTVDEADDTADAA
jgi:nitric oxide dioxygenase